MNEQVKFDISRSKKKQIEFMIVIMVVEDDHRYLYDWMKWKTTHTHIYIPLVCDKSTHKAREASLDRGRLIALTYY